MRSILEISSIAFGLEKKLFLQELGGKANNKPSFPTSMGCKYCSYSNILQVQTIYQRGKFDLASSIPLISVASPHLMDLRRSCQHRHYPTCPKSELIRLANNDDLDGYYGSVKAGYNWSQLVTAGHTWSLSVTTYY